jgi:hypothetical protein
MKPAPICQVLHGEVLTSVIQTIGSAIPDVVKDGVSNGLDYLEGEGIPRVKVIQTAHSIVSVVGLIEGASLAKQLSKIPIKEASSKVIIDQLPASTPTTALVLRPSTDVAEKRIVAYKDYLAGVASEKRALGELQGQPAIRKFSIQRSGSTVILRNLPPRFPVHLADFLEKVETHTFKATKIGVNQVSFEGQLFYRSIEDNVLFLMQYHVRNMPHKTIIGPKLTSSSGLYWHERLDHFLERAVSLSKEKGFKRVFLAWDSSKLPVATILQKRSDKVLGIGTFSAGINKAPLSLVEIAVKGIHK